MSLYQEITDQIIEQIEAGTPPWRQPWTGSASPSMPIRSNGEPYQGINVLMLWMWANKYGFTSPQWITFKQAKAMGGTVRKGEKGVKVVYFSVIEKENDEKIPFLKSYTVFNMEQCDGIEYQNENAPVDLGTQEISSLKNYFDRVTASIVTDNEPRAYYHPIKDYIHMPPISTFESAESYYAVLAHELVHWTGAEKRLDRIKKFANRQEYAFEELIAEIGSCILCAEYGLTPDIDQSAAYVESWLKALKNDNRLIFKAAAESQKAVNYINSINTEEKAA